MTWAGRLWKSLPGGRPLNGAVGQIHRVHFLGYSLGKKWVRKWVSKNEVLKKVQKTR